jgi:hypothetical protein
MIQSLQRHHPHAHLFLVCMDQPCFDILSTLQIPHLSLIQLSDLEAGDTELQRAQLDRSRHEYLWTLTPTIILRILERHPHVDVLTYIDSDMLFFQSVQPALDELAQNSVLIHEHRFPPALAHLSKYGIYNVGLLIFRNDPRGLSVLRWWRARCNEWCKAELEPHRYGDQKYLDTWPHHFDGVCVTQNIGVGVAPWNHSQYVFKTLGTTVFVNNTPLVIYHFHALRPLHDAFVVPVANTDYHHPISYFYNILRPYLHEFQVAIARVRTVVPDFRCGLSDPNYTVTTLVPLAIRNQELPQFEAMLGQQPRMALDENWTVFPGATSF